MTGDKQRLIMTSISRYVSTEGEQNLVPLRAIRIDLAERSITLETAEEPVAKLVFSSGTIYFQKPAAEPSEGLITPDEGPGDVSDPEPVAAGDIPGSRERQQALILSGKLKSKPRQGRPDSQGRPTTWARLAVHDEDQDNAHIFSATFHRGSASIALGLPMDAAVTVEGYAHPSNDPDGKRLDTLSVFRFLNYPGKPEPAAG